MQQVLRAAAIAAFCFSAPTLAAAEGERKRIWFATAYVHQFTNSNLADIPVGLATGNWSLERSYFSSVALNRVLVPRLPLDLPLVGRLLDGGSLELEGQFGLHSGLQSHTEATLALVWRTPDYALPLGTRMNFAVGEGLSYALARPAFEGVVNEAQPRRFLNYLAFEAEISHERLPRVALVPRIHHRSGIFGLIAPQGSGSNFVGLGLRLTLQ
ncbi:hypothetical protein [Falsiroseomonas sp. E2-1-a20]|uniref:hypothetical protein n=1 Tax=Falsiroseomonas sp. E2-1-a20 TaxID=3239300 RepID=UPI003F312C9F